MRTHRCSPSAPLYHTARTEGVGGRPRPGDTPSLEGAPATCGSSIRIDIAFVTSVLVVFFLLFYRSWPLWEDHAIYHYMAWGMRHGMVPYRDTINMNWPGSILVHLAAWAISGVDGLGLRLLDCLSLLLLAGVTARLLRALNVSAPLRLFALTTYLLAYFGSGYTQTAQRESFALPLVAVGVAECLIAALRGTAATRWSAAAGGLVAALGLSIKPTLVVPLLFAQAFPLIAQPTRRSSYAFVAWFTAGECAGALCLAAFLAAFCSPRGFCTWGIRYVLGPYSAAKWPLVQRVHHTLDWSLGSPATAFAVAGVVALIASWRARQARYRWMALVAFVALTAIMLGTAFNQGKTHCRYHYHPFFWGLSLVGAYALQLALEHVREAQFVRPAIATCATLLALLAADVVHRAPVPPMDGARLGAYLSERLRPSEEFVLFGFTPTLHARIKRRTPFPFIDSWVMLSCCGGRLAEVEPIIGRSLASAVRRPAVKCFLIHRNQSLLLASGWVSIDAIASKYLPDSEREALGYVRHRIRMEGGTEYEMWIRRPEAPVWPAKPPRAANPPA